MTERASRTRSVNGPDGEPDGRAGLSYVVVTDQYATISRLVDHLRQQTAREQMELVIVAPSEQRLGLDRASLEGFAGVRVVETRSIHPMTDCRAAGVRSATAPVVFLGETHSFPGPRFVATLIAAHEQPWDVVVPGLGNANPDNALSWSCFLQDYGAWFHDLPAGEIPAGPTWNVAYKRAALLELGDSLGSALSGGDELASAFRLHARRTYFEPAARLAHANVARFGSWIDERYLSGLLVGANRRERWSLWRRLLYVLASPLIPLVILSRVATPVRLLKRQRSLPAGTTGALVLGALVRTLGEVVGYLRGARPGSELRMEGYELHKLDYTLPPP